MDRVHVIRRKVLVEGHSVRRVAREMKVSRNTVRRHLDSEALVGERKASRRPVGARCTYIQHLMEGHEDEALSTRASRRTGTRHTRQDPNSSSSGSVSSVVKKSPTRHSKRSVL
jgi:hypothetical protein